MSKKYIGIGAGIVAGVTALVMPFISFAQVSTSTLGASIDTVNGTWYDYFTILLSHYWPFVVGVGVLLVVWHFGRRALNSFN